MTFLTVTTHSVFTEASCVGWESGKLKKHLKTIADNGKYKGHLGFRKLSITICLQKILKRHQLRIPLMELRPRIKRQMYQKQQKSHPFKKIWKFHKYISALFFFFKHTVICFDLMLFTRAWKNSLVKVRTPEIFYIIISSVQLASLPNIQ